MLKIFTGIFASCLFSHALGASQTLSTKIDALIAQRLPHAQIGILVKDAQTGQTIYSREADKLYAPGSGTKLFTAAAALYHLKPDYTIFTSLAQKDKDVYITFNGSPSLTIDNLNKLVSYLDMKTIDGDIILDSTRFKAPYYASGNSYDDLGWYYTAPVTAVILNENAADFKVISAKELGLPVQIVPEKADAGISISSQVIAISNEYDEDCRVNIDIKPHNTLRLYGCFAEYKQPKFIHLAITDPLFLAKQIVSNALDKQGIVLKGSIRSGKTPADARVISRFRSKNLIQLITHMLQESDNLYADSLYKQLAYSVTGEGSFIKGAFAMKKILEQYTHLDTNQLVLTDGAGTRYNLVTPEQMVVLLEGLYKDNNMRPIFLKALPQSGVSGTLKDRMKKTALEKNVFAKTGSLHDISSLSGYIIQPGSHPLIFSIIINGINTPLGTAKSLEDQLLLLIVSAPDHQLEIKK